MNTKLLEFLKTKCGDFGLNSKAIEELATIGSESITDESTDEDIESIAESMVPYAKAMQAEVTRKLQGRSRNSRDNEGGDGSQSDGTDGDGNGGGKGGDDVPEYLKKFMKEMREQNDQLSKKITEYEQKEKTAQRKAEISAKAKELGIAENLLKRINIGDDEDITEALTEYKQSLVDLGLPGKESPKIMSSSEEEVKEDAKSWAEKLPDN
jgi:hypothetical protein